MPCYTFQASGPAQLDSVGQRATPSDGPRISWGPAAAPADGYFNIGDLHINTLTGIMSTCTTAGLIGTAVFTPV
jgi:hypothetical protein